MSSQSSEKAPVQTTPAEKDLEKFSSHPSVDDENSSDSQPEYFKSRGVQRMDWVKASMDSTKKGKRLRIYFFVLLVVISWVSTFDSYTTYNYSPAATSAFGYHSLLSTISVADSIISAVSKIWIAKIADVTSRPWTYALALVFYTLGSVMAAASNNVTTYAAGSVFIAIGSSGIGLLNTIISGDITPLKYRGLVLGLLSTPYLINAWFTGLIVEAVLNGNWRWGYGMFCIIMPATVGPALLVMSWLEHKAKATQAALGAIVDRPKRSFKEKMQLIWDSSLECDFFGLLLLGFGWALLLLPFSLYTSASKGWKNPSLIAMFVVGGVLLVAYTFYEFYVAPHPSMPKRVLLNRTFMTASCIDFFYQLGGMIRLLYLSSYALVCFNWSYKNWTYFNNTFTMASCFFGVVVGVIQRYTHRTKYLQCFGLALQVVAMGITLWARYDHLSTAALVWTQILIGMGAACSVVGSQVASQASVPHQDMALVIALLSQWSSIGNAIGSAVAGAIWQTKMPAALRHYMPSSVNDTEVLTLYGSVMDIYALPFDSPEREAAKMAYFDVSYYLFAPALGLTCIPFLVSFFQKNFYLGDDQNAIESKLEQWNRPPKNLMEKVMRFCDEPFKYKQYSKKWAEETNGSSDK
ncbi:str3 [Cyberlindnera jadinii]|uniref:MFS general substrate transporter n=1 Tax=Cyberlindnera jadinii (strain ATCC 18201 / CBS 1600 / BCRC 20928 / JCM 3617 / NBRC 0987 / NRRL Y-1542) TaxID=983966 RepID=A0A0H5C8V0_CYBJN|nr:MFS general substrate transporter [Cyberlindnera jadinii NRRL Y-1542]ODV70645.1 MFS general substrate transporter [Cyberlindnera jadinii NRRL Y-1542]CEP24785.1 str3 [Cyberlindnera jadinii]